MARHIVLTNGDLTAGLDNYGQVQELYYPCDNTNNHCGNTALHHRIGVFCEGAVHWLDDGSWSIKQEYYPGRLISRTICDNSWLNIRLSFQDYIDRELNVLVRNIHVFNLFRRERNIKVFLHQSFILDSNQAELNQSVFIPPNSIKKILKTLPTIVHTNSSTAVAITATYGDDITNSFTEFSIGRFGDYNNTHMDGVWCDAADGILAGNKLDYGKTDSIIALDASLRSHDSACFNYYLAMADTSMSALTSLHKFTHEGVENKTSRNLEYWSEWLVPVTRNVRELISPKYRHDIIDATIGILAGFKTNGAILTTSINNKIHQPQVTPITSALSALALVRLGYDVEAGKVFDFFVEPFIRDGYLAPAYNANGSIGINNYHWVDNGQLTIPPFCLMDTAIVVQCLCESLQEIIKSNSVVPTDWKRRWNKLGMPLANFMCDYIDSITKLPLPSFNLNSNNPYTTVAGISAVYKALCASSDIAEQLNDVDGVIRYRMVADDINDNIDCLWNEQSGYFYGGILANDDKTIYNNSVNTIDLLFAKAANLFDENKLATAHETLIRLNVVDDGIYMRNQNDSIDDDYNKTQIMALSIGMNWNNSCELEQLLDSYAQILNKGGYLVDNKITVANNDILTRALFILACFRLSEISGVHNEV